MLKKLPRVLYFGLFLLIIGMGTYYSCSDDTEKPLDKGATTDTVSSGGDLF